MRFSKRKRRPTERLELKALTERGKTRRELTVWPLICHADGNFAF